MVVILPIVGYHLLPRSKASSGTIYTQGACCEAVPVKSIAPYRVNLGYRRGLYILLVTLLFSYFLFAG